MSAVDSSFRVKNTLVVNNTFVANSTVVNAAAINATSINSGTVNAASVNTGTANATTSVVVGANVTINTTAYFIGNSTVNTAISSTAIRTGNTTVNSAINSTSFSVANSTTVTTVGTADIRLGNTAANVVIANTVSSFSGNVGIGTASPGARLNVVDSTSADAVRITQTGSGNALVVEDSANPDTSPFVIDASGTLISGHNTAISGIAGLTPRIQVAATDASGSFFGSSRYGVHGNAGGLDFLKSRGASVGVNGIVSSGDTLGQVRFAGDDGTSFVQSASIIAAVDGAPGVNDMPGRLMFNTTADGAATPTERMRIDSSGNVVIGKTTALARLNLAAPDNVTTTYPFRVDNLSNNYGTGYGAYGMSNRVNPANESVDYTFDVGRHMLFRTADTERMRINGDGDIGIGVTTLSAKLDIVANTNERVFETTSNFATDDPLTITSHYLDINISGTNTALTSARVHTGMYIDVDSTAIFGNTTNDHAIYGIRASVDVSGPSEILGNYNDIRANNSTGTVPKIVGNYNVVEADPATGGTITDVVGTWNSVVSGGNGAVVRMYGDYNRVILETTGTPTLTEAFGGYNEVEIDGNAITSAYGTESVIDIDGGTIGTGYLYYGEYQGANLTNISNSYGVFVNGERNNYFSGNVGIGTSNPVVRLNISAPDNVTTTYPFRVDNNANNYGAGYGAYGMSNRVNALNQSVNYTFDIGRDAIFRAADTERMRIGNDGNITASGNVIINGNLVVTGTTMYANVQNLDVKDLNITVAKDVPSAALANGAGLTVDVAAVTWSYNHATLSWQSNVGITPASNNNLNIGTPNLVWASMHVTNVFATVMNTTDSAKIGGSISVGGEAIVNTFISESDITIDARLETGNTIATMNTTSVRVGNTTANAVVSTTSVRVGNATVNTSMTSTQMAISNNGVNVVVANSQGVTTSANVNILATGDLVLSPGAGIFANGELGTATHVLHSNGSSVYWAADDAGVTSVATGNGLTGGTITSTGTVSVLANTGIIANATGTYVNAAYIATLTANDSTNFGGLSLATVQGQITGNAATAYSNAITIASNATNLTTGTLPDARLSGAVVNTSGNFTVAGNINFTAANTNFANVNVGANVNVNTSSFFVGNATINAVVNSSSLLLSNTTSLTSIGLASIRIGNTTSNVVLSNTVSSFSGNVVVGGVVSDRGSDVRSIPQNAQTGAYTLTAADAARHISITTGGVTVPASVFAVGDAISIYNNSGSSQTITQGASVTLRQAGTATTGNRTLAQYGICTILCVGVNVFVISGAGIT